MRNDRLGIMIEGIENASTEKEWHKKLIISLEDFFDKSQNPYKTIFKYINGVDYRPLPPGENTPNVKFMLNLSTIKTLWDSMDNKILCELAAQLHFLGKRYFDGHYSYIVSMEDIIRLRNRARAIAAELNSEKRRIEESNNKGEVKINMEKQKINEKHRPTGVDKGGNRVFRKEADPVTGKIKKQTYYPANNLKGYADANNMGSDTMYKVGKVQARPSVAGKQNQGTVLNGFKEREGYTEKGNGSMIVRNPRGEEYEVPSEEFAKKYTHDGGEPDANGYSTYNVFNQRQVSSPVKHNLVKNMPNWGPGQKQFARKNDAHIVNPDSKDSYFIGDKELASTHVNNMMEESKTRKNMKKNTVKLNENTLRKMISESVKNVLNEGFFGNMFGKGRQAQAQQAPQSQVSNPNATWYLIQWSKNLQGDDCFRLKNVETGEEYGWMDDGSPCRIMGKVIKNPNGNPIPHEDYHIDTFNMLRKFSTNGGQSQGVARQAQTAVRESKSLVKINENTLKQIVAESVKKVLKESIDKEKLASLFVNWALNDSHKYRGLGGPVNAPEAMHDYYYDNDDEPLYRAAEAFSEVNGFDVNEVFEAAKMASNYYFAYNPDYDREQD